MNRTINNIAWLVSEFGYTFGSEIKNKPEDVIDSVEYSDYRMAEDELICKSVCDELIIRLISQLWSKYIYKTKLQHSFKCPCKSALTGHSYGIRK